MGFPILPRFACAERAIPHPLHFATPVFARWAGSRVFETSIPLIHNTRQIDGYDGGSATRLYALSGGYGFFIVTVDSSDDDLSISVNLRWPSGDEQEVSQKKIKLV